MDAIKPGKGRSLASAKVVTATERLARADVRIATAIDEWDCDCFLLNAANGIVDLHTGEPLPHDRKLLMTKITVTELAPVGTPAPLWSAFLKRITNQDADLENYLQRVTGYCLTGSTKAQALFFAYGVGQNGKGVFKETVMGVLGDYAKAAPMETFIASNTPSHPTDLASLCGSRFVTATETTKGRRWDESRILALTGEDRISARLMRCDFFEYLPTFKLFISGNHKPALRSVTPAIRRRFHLIPFAVRIPDSERDDDLKDKLRAEWDGDSALGGRRLPRMAKAWVESSRSGSRRNRCLLG